MCVALIGCLIELLDSRRNTCEKTLSGHDLMNAVIGYDRLLDIACHRSQTALRVPLKLMTSAFSV